MPGGQPELTKHIDRLYRAAWAMCGSREDAEDLVQETYAKVLARPRKVRRGRELAYLLAALRNTHASTYRAAARRPAGAGSFAIEEVAAERGGGEPEQALEVHELFAAIARLPDDFRLALIAVDVVGLSYREAAEALGTIEATITTRLHRARRDVVRAITPAGDPAAVPAPARGGIVPRREGALAGGGAR